MPPTARRTADQLGNAERYKRGRAGIVYSERACKAKECGQHFTPTYPAQTYCKRPGCPGPLSKRLKVLEDGGVDGALARVKGLLDKGFRQPSWEQVDTQLRALREFAQQEQNPEWVKGQIAQVAALCVGWMVAIDAKAIVNDEEGQT